MNTTEKTRKELLREIESYRIPLRDRLPAIAIPLRRDDRDVPLDLQSLVDQCYEIGC